jgi:hypothetical protein
VRNSYEKIAAYYEARFGEEFVADWDWVAPFYDAAGISVEMAADYTDLLSRNERYGEEETVARTAVAIAIITHGEEILYKIPDLDLS